jgi:hypothetical protein
VQYWKWLFVGADGHRPGCARFLDRWLFLHLLVGVGMAYVVPVSLSQAANAVLLPLAGIFIGLSFAWGGNANALLQTEEILDVSRHVAGGLAEYAYVYATAILILLATVAIWGIAGLDVFDKVWPTHDSFWYGAISGLTYGVSSVALRECWHVVLGAQYLLLSRSKVQQLKRDKQ